MAAAFVGHLGASSAHAATVTEYARTSQGASFVSASSFNAAAVSPGNLTTMQNDVVADTQVAWHPDSDTRYIFGNGDNDQWLEIDLGQVRQVNTIGASFGVPPTDDRFVVGPFSVKVSTDGTTFSDWGSPVTITNATTTPVLISLATTGVRYIQYFFGPTGPMYGNDGSAVNRVFAQNVAATPIPGSLLMFLTAGAAMAGLAARRRATKSVAA
jgi:hypothetical protein